RILIVAAGGWLGYMFLTPLVKAQLENHIGQLPVAPEHLWPAIGGAAGGIIAWLASRPINLVLMLAFRLFNRTFNLITAGYVGIVRVLLFASVLVLIGYGGLL